MKVYSWNMYYHSKKLGEAFRYIESLDFDVLCLQEVPEEMLKRLAALPYHSASAVDIAFFSKKKEGTIYAVVLSRYPIRASEAIVFPRVVLPRRARLLLKMRTGWTGHYRHGSVYADIDTGRGLVRVFSLHLALSSPSDRKKEFDVVKSFLPRAFPAILAGDFNVIEHSLTKPLNWFAGSSLSEAMPWHRERKHAEARFRDVRLKNPLRGRVTHGFSRSQLDHILVPEDVKVLRAEVVRKTYGSDHHPVLVEVSDT